MTLKQFINDITGVITIKDVIIWIICGLLLAGAAYCLSRCQNEFKNEYTEPEVIQQNP